MLSDEKKQVKKFKICIKESNNEVNKKDAFSHAGILSK